MKRKDHSGGTTDMKCNRRGIRYGNGLSSIKTATRVRSKTPRGVSTSVKPLSSVATNSRAICLCHEVLSLGSISAICRLGDMIIVEEFSFQIHNKARMMKAKRSTGRPLLLPKRLAWRNILTVKRRKEKKMSQRRRRKCGGDSKVVKPHPQVHYKCARRAVVSAGPLPGRLSLANISSHRHPFLKRTQSFFSTFFSVGDQSHSSIVS